MAYRFDDKAAVDAALNKMYEKHPPSVTVDMAAGPPEGMSAEEHFFSDEPEYDDSTMSLFDELLGLVPEQLLHESGEVFLSGRTAFEQPSPLYVLGYNPGGRPDALDDWTIERDIESLREDRHDWTGLDDEWSVYGARRTSYAAGQSPFQRRVKHLFAQCHLDPKRVPFNNCLFLRSSRVHTLAADPETLLRLCWPVHERVIAALGVRIVVCLGQDAGWWLRKQLGAHTEAAAPFVEDNKRRWRSTVHKAVDGPYAGLQVVTLTHPSTANWINHASDPTGLVVRALAAASPTASSRSEPRRSSSASPESGSTSGASGTSSPTSTANAWRNERTPKTSTPATSEASATWGSGTRTRSAPRAAAAITIGSTPGTQRSRPSRVSSPISTAPARAAGGTGTSPAARTPIAIARSNFSFGQV